MSNSDNPWGKGRKPNKPKNNSGGENPWGDFNNNFGGSKKSDSKKSSGNPFQNSDWGGGNNARIDDFGKILEKLPFKAGPAFIFALIIGAILIWLASGIYIVGPKERGVELLFGEFNEETIPGLHYNFPAPIGNVFLPQVTNVNQVEIGFRSGNTGSGIGNRGIIQESLMLTGDENIIDIQFVVFWKIRNAKDFLFNVRNPQASVKNASEAAMREIVGKSDFETVRTSGRTQLGQQAKMLLQSILDSYQAGIEIVNVNLQSIDPPSAVIDAFRDVQAARADKERAVNEATAYFNEIVERSQGQAEQITLSAEAYKEERIANATGESSRFLAVLNEYLQEKDITRRRIYLQTMEEILSDVNKVFIDQDGNNQGVVPYLPLDSLNQKQTRRTNNDGGINE